MQIVYQSNIQDKRYDSEVETVVYRVVQEAVFNALKYAGVSSVDVFVQEVGRLLMAEVIIMVKVSIRILNHKVQD